MLSRDRPAEVEPFLRGALWPALGEVAYPRADPNDAGRLPADTWATATVPAGVRLEMVGDATDVDVSYVTTTDDFGWRGPAAGSTFAVWRDGEPLDERPALLGSATLRLHLGAGEGRAIVYLPEGMKPLITGLAPVGGSIDPAPAQPRWVAYGDSITEGWNASGPSMTWTAIAGREVGLDVANLGYAGSARGEAVSAEHIASVPADVISLAFGTNCWSRTPYSPDMIKATTDTFLRIVRSGHPSVPLVLLSPLVRPDAEQQPNELGATLADLRRAMEEAVLLFADHMVTMIAGLDVVAPSLLGDGIHPDDAGHRVLASVVGEAVSNALATANPRLQG